MIIPVWHLWFSGNFTDIMMSGNCSINSANTNFLEYSSIDRPGTIKIGMLEAGNINLYVSKEDFFEIGNLKSTNIEGWSETYNSQDEIDKNCEAEKRKILELYL